MLACLIDGFCFADSNHYTKNETLKKDDELFESLKKKSAAGHYEA
jgi:hypothetical protein